MTYILVNVMCVFGCVRGLFAAADPGYVTSISRADQSSLERRVNFSELINPSNNPVDTSNVSLYEALKSVIEWTGQVRRKERREREKREHARERCDADARRTS